MRNKQTVLVELRELLDSGELTKSEIQGLIGDNQREASSVDASASTSVQKISRLSAIDIMFVIGGVILFASVQALIDQLGLGVSTGLFGTMICLAIAVALWGFALVQSRQKQASEVGRGMGLSFILTGSLLLVAAAVHMTNALMSGSGASNDDLANNLYTFGFLMLGVALFHVIFAWLVRRQLVVGAGILAACSALVALAIGALVSVKIEGADPYVLVFIGAAVFLAVAARMVVRIKSGALHPRAFDGLAQFIALVAMTIATFNDWHMLWYPLIICVILGLFYVSIRQKSQPSLVIAAFFLTVTLISMSFRYFSGLGIAFSLLLAAVAVLGVATVSVSLRKKYLVQE